MAYKCFNCGKEIDAKGIERRVICPYCSSRIIKKVRPAVIKKIKAR